MQAVTVHVEVTKDDIKKGKRNDAAQCAIARALRRATGRRRWFVFRSRLEVWRGKFHWIQDSPPVLQKFVRLYDAGFNPEPFSFDLDVPEDLVKSS